MARRRGMFESKSRDSFDRVVKLGGSLLDLSDLVERFSQWLAEPYPGDTFLLVGGGPTVDALRRAHARGEISDVDAHWQAITAMRDNALRLIAKLHAPGIGTDSPTPMQPAGTPRLDGPTGSHDLHFVDPLRFMREVDPRLPGGPLPVGWEVTSDSIAARVALAATADELVFLKSRLSRTGGTHQELADEGLVDGYFPTAVAGIARVTVVDFRNGRR